MKFKVDENLPKEIKETLETSGYDTQTVYEENLTGIDDYRLIELCATEERCLITADLDFADIISYPPLKYQGIVVIRSPKMTRKIQLQLLKDFLKILPAQSIKNRLFIIEPGRIRIHENKE